MRRSAFITRVAAAALSPAIARAQDEFSPEMSTNVESLRVLLGRGTARPRPEGGFTFNGRPYRGTFIVSSDGSVVSTVPLEQYLYSVVPREMPPSWPAAALQAQAICARTYVLQRSSPRRSYDLVPSEADQVYGGILSESPAGRAAVDGTARQVLRFGDAFAQIEYSSCCGGHTEASSDAWGSAPISYLNGVVCPYCTASPYYRWQRNVALASIAAAFSSEIAGYGSLREVHPGAADPSGRLRTVELRCDRGSAFVKGTQFRMRVGPRVIPSLLMTKIEPAEAPGNIRIEGGGLGHGVGLCQWGARGMALGGASSSNILDFYLPGTTIAND